MNIETKKKIIKILAVIILIVFVAIILCTIILRNMNRNNMNTITSKNLNIQLFNAKFEQYSGKQPGRNIGVLINDIITSNATDQSGKIVSLSLNNDDAKYLSNDLETLKKQISNTKMYRVSLQYENDGYVKKININEQ